MDFGVVGGYDALGKLTFVLLILGQRRVLKAYSVKPFSIKNSWPETSQRAAPTSESRHAPPSGQRPLATGTP